MPSLALSNVDNTLPRLPNHDGAVICAKVVIPSGLARAGRESGHDNDSQSFMISDSNPVTVVYKSALRRFTDKTYISFPNAVSFGRATANEVEMYCMWDSDDTYFGDRTVRATYERLIEVLQANSLESCGVFAIHLEHVVLPGFEGALPKREATVEEDDQEPMAVEHAPTVPVIREDRLSIPAKLAQTQELASAPSKRTLSPTQEGRPQAKRHRGGVNTELELAKPASPHIPVKTPALLLPLDQPRLPDTDLGPLERAGSNALAPVGEGISVDHALLRMESHCSVVGPPSPITGMPCASKVHDITNIARPCTSNAAPPTTLSPAGDGSACGGATPTIMQRPPLPSIITPETTALMPSFVDNTTFADQAAALSALPAADDDSDVDMRVHIDMLHMTLEHLEEERTKAEHEHAELKTGYAALEQRCLALKKARSALRREKSALETTNAALRKEVAALQREHDGCEEKLEDAEQKSTELGRENEALRLDAAQREGERLQLADKCAEAEREMRRSADESAKLFSVKMRLKRENQKLVVERSQLLDRIALTARELSVEREKRREGDKRAVALTYELRRLAAPVHALHSQYIALVDELDAVPEPDSGVHRA